MNKDQSRPSVVSPEQERIAEQIDELVSEAYEIGHAHGQNALPMAFGVKPKRVDEGWGTIADKLKELFLSALALQVEKEKENLGSETPLPLGQQSEETNGNPPREYWICLHGGVVSTGHESNGTNSKPLPCKFCTEILLVREVTEPSPASTASIHESARRNPKSDFNEGGMT